jgi:hypothetical protein
MESLAQKIVDARRQMNHPAQSGYNDYENYGYSTRNDILQEVRPVLNDVGIALFTSCEHLGSTRVGETKSGTPKFKTQVEVSVTLVDMETGQEHTSTWDGESKSSDDKGIQQAATQALRFWALNTFLLMDDSVEQTHQSGGSASGGQNVHRESAQSPRDQIAQRLRRLGYDNDDLEDFGAYIAGIEGAESFEAVPDPRMQVWANQLANSNDEEVHDKVKAGINKIRQNQNQAA